MAATLGNYIFDSDAGQIFEIGHVRMFILLRNKFDFYQDFLEKKRLRLIDLFRSFDKDLSWKITPLEFKKGIMNAGIRLSKHQLRQLMASLDIDVDGQVNYK